MKKILIYLVILPLFSLAQEGDWQTYYELSGHLETPRYDETIAFCKKLADESPIIHYTTFGISPQGRELPLLIASRNGYFDPGSAKAAGNAVLLVQACIHPGESEGKDAGLTFLRDLAIYDKYPSLLRNVTLLFIPIFNVDGHERFGPYNRINQNGPLEMGWRTTSQNLNLNRDYLKAETGEMQAWLEMFNDWLPDFFIDIHTSDGADYQYVSTYELETKGNMEEVLTEWTLNTYIPFLEPGMENAGMPIFPYVAFRRWHDPRSGLRTNAAGPRYSQGYTATQNRIGLLIETHMLKEYRLRVEASYEQVRLTCELLEKESAEIRRRNALADSLVASPSFRAGRMPVDWEPTGDSVMVEFRGVEYDVVESDLTGGDWFVYHPDKPVTFSLPFFKDHEPSRTVSVPEAYLIPPQWKELIKRLDLHGVEYSKLDHETFIPVETYEFTEAKWASRPFEGKLRLNVLDHTVTFETKKFPEGTVIVPTGQRAAKVIVHLLEPGSDDSMIRWGYFNSIFEQKEYAESYVMEGMARKMFEEDPGLEKEFREMLEENPGLAGNQWLQLNWIYQRSPYRDRVLNVYPVARITQKQVVDELLNE